jgi:hypothetical protein
MKAEKTTTNCFYLLMLSCLLVIASLLVFTGEASTQQDYPMLEMVASKVIQKYQQSTCEQLWQDRGKPKPEMEQRAIQMLRSDPQMRQTFINKVAAPIANKLFECGMIP